MTANTFDWLRCLSSTYGFRFKVYMLVGIVSLTGFRAAVGYEARIDYVVAVVNNQAITWSELRSALVIRAFVDPLVSLLPPLLDELKDPSEEAQRTILDILVDRTFLLQEAERWGIPLTRWQDKVAANMARLKKSYPSDLDFFETLELSGLEYAELEEWMRVGLIINDLIFRKFINRIDEEKVEQESLRHFEQHKSAYSEAAQVRFKSVLVPLSLDASLQEKTQAERTAEAVYSSLINGMSIQEIQQSKQEFAEIKPDTRTESVDSKPGMTIASLKTNRWNPPIRTHRGYLVVYSLGVEKRRQQAYTVVKDEIKWMLIDKQVDEQLEEWLAEQKEIGSWRILHPSLARIDRDSPRNKP